MVTIFKYTLEVRDEQFIEIPTPLGVLTLALQDDKPTVWAVVESTTIKEKFRIVCHGTGNPIEEDINNLQYIGTVQIASFVWHYFVDIQYTTNQRTLNNPNYKRDF